MMATENEAEQVKVLFRLEKDEDGYPPVEVESLWGFLTSEGIQLDNIPFFAKGVALGDLVKVQETVDGALEFDSVVRRGGHSTYRVLLLKKHPADPRHTMGELVALGLSVEEDAGLLAVGNADASLKGKGRVGAPSEMLSYLRRHLGILT